MMMMMRYECKRCGHSWEGRLPGGRRPVQCPRCRSGAWWEERTGLPLPLGAILARRDLGEELIRALDQAVRRSLEYAWAHPEETLPYLKAHAQELSEEVIWAHVRTYVNAYSLDVGEEGERAVERLFAEAEARGLIPPSPWPLFL